MKITLISPAEAWFDGNQIHFMITVNGDCVACCITADCLAYIAEKNRLSRDSYRATFGLHHHEIEALARLKFLSGVERPVITAADLEDLPIALSATRRHNRHHRS